MIAKTPPVKRNRSASEISRISLGRMPYEFASRHGISFQVHDQLAFHANVVSKPKLAFDSPDVVGRKVKSRASSSTSATWEESMVVLTRFGRKSIKTKAKRFPASSLSSISSPNAPAPPQPSSLAQSKLSFACIEGNATSVTKFRKSGQAFSLSTSNYPASLDFFRPKADCMLRDS
jgi:hypothetical protein